MWTRLEIKKRAKKVLSKTYILSFVVALVLLFVGGSLLNSIGNSGSGSSHNSRNDDNYSYHFNNNEGQIYIDEYEGIVIEDNYIQRSYVPFNPMINILRSVLTVTLFVAGIGFLIFKVFVGYNLTVGGYRYFLRTGEGSDENLNSLTFGFKEGRFGNILITMLLRDLYTFLWALLFVVPGIMKLYSYRMVPYILADNPKLSPNRALEISKDMMYGERWKTFVLDISFFGWKILAVLIPFIGIPILAPYVHATDAQLYIILRDKMIARNNVSPEELNLVAVTIEGTVEPTGN